MSEQALFTLDLNRCTGCSACSIACRTENDVGSGLGWRHVYTFNEAHLPNAGVFHFSLACNHCAEPACLYGCPAKAYTKDERTGAVLLDHDHCIGCRYCSWVCPYGAPQYNPLTRVMEKCTFCSHRLAEDLEPACVTACPVDALGFAHRGEPDTARHPGFPDVGLRPGLHLTAKRRHSAPPEMTPLPESDLADLPAAPSASIELADEWPLLAFTLVASILVAWFTASAAGSRPPNPIAFALVAGSALAVSTLHLGRPLRAWRAVLNIRHSWLSREVASFSAFAGLALVSTTLGPLPQPLQWLTVALGFTALFSVDMVYRVPGQSEPAVPHSAMTTLTAAYLLGLMIGDPILALAAGSIKLVLYGVRVPRQRLGSWPAILRIAGGFLLPLALWLLYPSGPVGLLLAGPLLGELIDRIEFYSGLGFLSPQRQIDLDLEAMTRPTLS
ncbi:MAG: DmsC/YnfH family molybdoenzyme membrane anchor subunit [Thermoanaerobaculia bacterium]